jgi:hypothetical protein
MKRKPENGSRDDAAKRRLAVNTNEPALDEDTLARILDEAPPVQN